MSLQLVLLNQIAKIYWTKLLQKIIITIIGGGATAPKCQWIPPSQATKVEIVVLITIPTTIFMTVININIIQHVRYVVKLAWPHHSKLDGLFFTRQIATWKTCCTCILYSITTILAQLNYMFFKFSTVYTRCHRQKRKFMGKTFVTTLKCAIMNNGKKVMVLCEKWWFTKSQSHISSSFGKLCNQTIEDKNQAGDEVSTSTDRHTNPEETLSLMLILNSVFVCRCAAPKD